MTQEEIIVYDLASTSQVTVSHEPWKDEDLRITTQRQFDYPDSDEPDRSLWISDDSEELHFVRLSGTGTGPRSWWRMPARATRACSSWTA